MHEPFFPITLQVTDTHLCQLAQVVRCGEDRMPEGLARFLAMIAPQVWPGVRLAVEPLELACNGEAFPAKVTVLREYEVCYTFKVSTFGVSLPGSSRRVWASSVDSARTTVEAEVAKSAPHYRSPSRDYGDRPYRSVPVIESCELVADLYRQEAKPE